jgi:hypothetical protein
MTNVLASNKNAFDTPKPRAALIVLAAVLLLASAGLAAAQDDNKIVTDQAWRGPGWYWYQGSMFGVPMLSGKQIPGSDKQAPFGSQTECEQTYHRSCTYYGSDPAGAAN